MGRIKSGNHTAGISLLSRSVFSRFNFFFYMNFQLAVISTDVFSLLSTILLKIMTESLVFEFRIMSVFPNFV